MMIILMFTIVVCLQAWILYLVLYDKPPPMESSGPVVIRKKPSTAAYAKGEKIKPIARSEQEEWEMEQNK